MEFLSFLVILSLFSLSRTAFVVVNTIRPSEFMRDNNTALLVSKGGKFELGFFTPTDSSSNNRYLGIWYKNIAVQTIVWVANRCEPIIDSSALLTIDNTGNLVLFQARTIRVCSFGLQTPRNKPGNHLFSSWIMVTWF
ncbi:hypothetical protein CsatB_028755 [Cannabis sativa]